MVIPDFALKGDANFGDNKLVWVLWEAFPETGFARPVMRISQKLASGFVRMHVAIKESFLNLRADFLSLGWTSHLCADKAGC